MASVEAERGSHGPHRMSLGGDPSTQQTRKLNSRATESAREREVFRLLKPWNDRFHPTTFARPLFSHSDERPDAAAVRGEPVGCDDTALAAFAQLGVTRMDAQRCVISLLSSTTEYVLAESTKTLSLQHDISDEAGDELWMGTCAFPRDEGLNAIAIHQWHKAKESRAKPTTRYHYYTEGQSHHWFILSDAFSCAEYQTTPLVDDGKRFPLRFFCSIPIRTHNGSVVGALAVMDTKPRYGVSAREMNFMEDMAETVMKHLEANRSTAQQKRSERLIKALGLFNSGQGTLRDWWMTKDEAEACSGRSRAQKSSPDAEKAHRMERANEEFGSIDTPEEFERARETTGHTGHSHSVSASFTSANNTLAAGTRDAMNIGCKDFGTPSTDSQETTLRRDHTGRSKSAESVVTSNTAESSAPGPSEGPKKGSAFDLAREIDRAYARASNLMREALAAEGALFLDANIPQIRERRPLMKLAAHEAHATSASETDTDAGDASAPESTSKCPLLGFSTRIKSSLRGFLPSQKHMSLPKRFLARLIQRYPDGRVFNFNEGGALYSSSGEDNSSASDTKTLTMEVARGLRRTRSRAAKEAAALADVLSGVQSLAFLPLWDTNRERTTAVALVWTNTPLRLFDAQEDIAYLAAFGNSLMTEIARLETVAADQAKGTFISSVSHELRSPLHGVLGGVEMLQGSDLSAFQQEMAMAIKMAGTTLLDTVSNILDYVKIDNLTASQRRELAKEEKSREATEIAEDCDKNHGIIDLARLTEEVVDVVVAGKRFQVTTTNQDLAHRSSFSASPSPRRPDRHLPPSRPLEDISVVVDIAWRSSWWIRLSPGSWTRVLTNLVGNALKYTKSGTIRVTMTAGDVQSTKNGHRVPVQLVVEDTGIGIGKEYLDHSLYTPFTQENANSNGTGLGLSIVKQIIRSLGGNMMTQSTAGVGTTVTVDFIADLVPNLPQQGTGPTDDGVSLAMRRFQGRSLSLSSSVDAPDKLPDADTRALQASVFRICSQWLGISCNLSHLEDGRFNGIRLSSIDQSGRPWESEEHLHAPLYLSPAVNARPVSPGAADFHSGAIFVNQPIGPRKLARALLESIDRPIAQGRSSIPRPDTPGRTATCRSGTIPAQSAGSPNCNDGSRASPSIGRRSPRACHAIHGEAEPVASTNGTPQSKIPARSFPINWTPTTRHSQTSTTSLPLSPRSSKRKSFIPAAPIDKCILLVEDNEINMRLLTALMHKLQLPYQRAENGLVALQTYTAAPSSFFLILMDMSMPVMDGYAATEAIRTFEKQNGIPRCRTVALTGVVSEEARKNAFVAGVDKFMAKPVSMRGVEALVEESRGDA